MDIKIRVGIVGTGGIAKGLVKLLNRSSDMTVSDVLTRRLGKIEGLELSTNKVHLIPE
jgi:predicted dinucleotide-utilizing enzyme